MTALRTNFPARNIGKPIDYESLKRRGYLDQGLVIVSINDPRLNWTERELIKEIGKKLYGAGRGDR